MLLDRRLVFVSYSSTSTDISTLSLHDALPICFLERIDAPEKNWKISLADIEERRFWKDYMKAYETCLSATSTSHRPSCNPDRKSTRLNSSHLGISYAVFCLKKKN